MISTFNNVNKSNGVIILAGGDSKRLGQPKAFLDFQGLSLIELMVKHLEKYFSQLTVITDRPERYKHLPVKLTSDIIENENKSPLRGIHAGLSFSDLAYQFVAACDMPFLNLDLIGYMSGFAADYDAVVPHIGEHYQPLHAFYSRSCIETIERQISSGCYKVTDFYRHLNIKFITLEEIVRFDPEQQSFININRWSDYEAALDVYKKKHKQ